MNKKQIQKLIEYIKSGEWIYWSDDDYNIEFWEEQSIKCLLDKIKEISENTPKTKRRVD